MTDPRERDAVVYDTEGAAGYLAALAIDEPTFVDVTAYGPLDAEGIVPRSSKRMLLLPGEDVLGEGVILELNGFTVEILEAEPSSTGKLRVRARVTMLCGCPTEPSGLWDADDITVRAKLTEGDEVVSESALAFTGPTSTFGGEMSAPTTGPYVLEVTASEPAEGNFGFARRVVDLQ